SNNFDALFSDPKHLKSVKLAVNLLGRVAGGTGVTRLCACFNQFIKSKGKLMVHLVSSAPEREKTLIQDLLDFKDQMDTVVRECFSTVDRFAQSLKEAFETFINIKTNKMAELIAKYVDGKLRLSSSNAQDVNFDQLVDKVL